MNPLKRGLFIDPPATLLRKPSASPIVTPEECIAVALTCSQWKPGRIVDPNGDVVNLVLKSLKREGWKIVPMERGDYGRND